MQYAAAFVLALTLTGKPIVGAAGKNAPIATTSDAECDRNQPGTHRSETAVNPKSGLRAYAQIDLAPKTKKDGYCTATWSISFHRESSRSRSRLDFKTEEAEGWGLEMEILGFIPNQDVLVVRLIRWAGDYTEYEMILANLGKHSVRLIDVRRMLTKRERQSESCPIWLYPLGIDGRNRVVIDAGSSEDLDPGQRPCFSNSRWIVDPKTGTREQKPTAVPLALEGAALPAA